MRAVGGSRAYSRPRSTVFHLRWCNMNTSLFREIKACNISGGKKKGYWNVCNELWRICWGGGGGGGGGFRMSCYLGALIISVIKPSGNTCTAWIIHQQLQGHLVRFVFFFFPPSPWPSKTSQSVTGKARMSERRQSQFGLKPPTRKWEVQKGKRRRKV